MTLRTLFLACTVSVGLLSCSSVSGESEVPEYTVERAEDAFEIRGYGPVIYAEVTTTGTREEASGKAFRQLAAYIFDDERPEGGIAMTAPVVQQPSREKIAMTAPVIQQPAREKIAMTAPVVQAEDAPGEWTMAFSMPPKWTMATLPKPQNPNIRLFEEPSRKVAAVEFSGRANDTMLAKNEDALRKWMSANGIVASGPAEYAFYDAPWVIGPLRRNEVIIPVQ